MDPAAASAAAPAISQVLIYIVMAAVLVWRPTGLFGQRAMRCERLGSSPRTLITALLLLLLAALPLISQAANDRYILSVGTRIVIWAIAAVSLNMILGYGGLVSFGHAAFIGIGGYAVGILSANGIQSGWVQWPVALLAATVWAALVGGAVAAHPRRLLHHDHAGLRAAGLLPRLRPRSLWRRRRAQHQPQPLPRPDRPARQGGVPLAVLRPALRHPVVLRPLRPFAASATCCAAPGRTRAAWPRWASRCSAIAWSPA